MNKILFTITLSIVIFSCQKAEIDTDFKTAQDNANAENLFLDIPAQIIPVLNGYIPVSSAVLKNPVPSSNNLQNFSCGTLTILSTFDTTTNSYGFPFKFEINYGNGCTDNFDNKTRKGKLSVTVNNYWDSVNTSVTITANNYYVNNQQLSGTLQLTYTDETHFTVTLDQGKITSGSYTTQFSTQKNVFYQTGYATDTIMTDDSYKISGNSYGFDRTNRPYTTNTIVPFIKKTGCGYIEKGVFEITPEGLSTRTVNYGDSICDNQATVTINGNNFDFELK